MNIPNDQKSALDEFDLEAEMAEELEVELGAAEGVRGGALQPYLYIEGTKQGDLKGGCPPAAR